MNYENNKQWAFPDELVSPKEKESNEYGLKWAKAIYYNSNRNGNGGALFNNDNDVFRTYMDYALGKQDQNQYKPLLGINPKNIKSSALPAIRWGIRNYATKKINVVVSKVTNRQYDPIVEAIDKLATDAKRDLKARATAYVNDKEWVQKMSGEMGQDLTPKGMDPNNLPEKIEDVEMMSQTGMKMQSEVELELGLEFHFERNNFNELRKQLVFDTFVLGVCCALVDDDAYGMPVAKRIPIEEIYLPYSEIPDFSNINYGGHTENYTISELKRMAGDFYTNEEYERIADEFAHSSDRDRRYNDESENSRTRESSDVEKIKVLRFEFETHDELVHLSKVDTDGNRRFKEQDYDYYRSSKEQKKFDKKYGSGRDKSKNPHARKIKRTPFTSTYIGYWIVGSDIRPFNYKRKSKRASMMEVFGGSNLGYKIYAPNIYTGEVFSTVKQMMPVLDNLQSYNLKLQHMVASAVPKGIEIDLYQLSQAKFLGNNKKEMTDMEKIDFYKQKGVMVRNSGGRTQPGTNNTPIKVMENGMANDVVKIMDLMRYSLEELDDIIGVNRAMSGGNLHQDSGKATTEMQIMASETAIDYIYDADESIFLNVAKSLANKHVLAVKSGVQMPTFNKVFGSNSVGFLMSDNGLTKHDYGLKIEARPAPEDWQRFYMRLEKALDRDQITIDHAAAVEDLKNLKLAKSYLKYAVIEKRKVDDARKEADIQMNAQAQQESAQMANDLAMQLEQEKKMTIQLEGEQERETLKLKYQLENELQSNVSNIKGDYKIAETGNLTKSKENIEVLKSLNQEKNNQNG